MQTLQHLCEMYGSADITVPFLEGAIDKAIPEVAPPIRSYPRGRDLCQTVAMTPTSHSPKSNRSSS